MIRKTMIAVAAIGLMSLSGCNIYFGPDTDGCEFGDCGGDVAVPPGGDVVEPGGECGTNDQCAAACFCSIDAVSGEGTCVETGFCESALDCAMGFECDSRNTCVPQQFPTSCEDDAACAQGCFCAVPTDGAAGTCEETGFCATDDDCEFLAGLNGVETYVCDLARQTCVPQPEVSCEDLLTEQDCQANASCAVNYRGINCTDPNGGSCTSGQANCTCERFEFASCQTIE